MKAFNKLNFIRPVIGSLIVLSIGLIYASFTIRAVTNDVIKMLGISPGTLESKITSSLINGYLDHGNIDQLKYLASGEKLLLLNELCIYMKEYASGDEFKFNYQLFREQAKPQKPELINTDAIIWEQINQHKKSIVQAEESFRDASIEIKEMLYEGLEGLKEQLKELEDPNSQMARTLIKSEEKKNKKMIEKYEEEVKDWEKNYPEDHDMFIRSRLLGFLELTEDVNFDAELEDSYDGMKKFVNPQYESKPAEWKKAFRAGKEVTENARQFAVEWLEELSM